MTEYKAATIVLKDSQAEGKYAPAQDVTEDINEVDKLKVWNSVDKLKVWNSVDMTILLNFHSEIDLWESKENNYVLVKAKFTKPLKFQL